ncbi:hypothetical protein ACFL3M_00460 [Patescibacteria group bacterium]
MKKKLGKKFGHWAKNGKKGHPRSVAAVTGVGPRKPKPSGCGGCGGCGSGCGD